ncbi:MAG TPA: hypothetical protein VF824_11350 [Thermoanaerobaculia bacterium]
MKRVTFFLLAALLTTSAFALERGRGYRENGRVVEAGRVRSFERDRDGFRVWLDRHDLPFLVRGVQASDLRTGVYLRLAGVYHDGYVECDRVAFGQDRYSDRGYRDYGNVDDRDTLRGEVDRVGYRYGTLRIRAEDGRFITVDVRRAARRSRYALDDLRRGDIVTLSGVWEGERFKVAGIEEIE